MGVIVLVGPCFSGATSIAAALRDDCGYRQVDDNAVMERAAAWGVPQDAGRAALHKPSRFARREARQHACLSLIRAALVEELKGTPAVYCGDSGYLLLNQGGRLLRIRVIAPLESRIRNAQESLKLSRSEAAACIREADRARREWVRWYYDSDWEDPALYDLVINAEYMDTGYACTAILEAATRWEGYESEMEVAGLALSSFGNAVLNREPSARGLDGFRWAAVLLLVTLGLGVPLLLRLTAGAKVQTVTGVITDTKCGAAHEAAPLAERSACVTACIRLDRGVKYALYDGTRLYVLSDQSTPARFAARAVTVRGIVDAKARTLAVRSIVPMPWQIPIPDRK